MKKMSRFGLAMALLILFMMLGSLLFDLSVLDAAAYMKSLFSFTAMLILFVLAE